MFTVERRITLTLNKHNETVDWIQMTQNYAQSRAVTKRYWTCNFLTKGVTKSFRRTLGSGCLQLLYGGGQQRGLLPLLYTRILSASGTIITGTPIICQLRRCLLWHFHYATLACKQSETCKACLPAFLALRARLILVRV